MKSIIPRRNALWDIIEEVKRRMIDNEVLQQL